MSACASFWLVLSKYLMEEMRLNHRVPICLFFFLINFYNIQASTRIPLSLILQMGKTVTNLDHFCMEEHPFLRFIFIYYFVFLIIEFVYFWSVDNCPTIPCRAVSRLVVSDSLQPHRL